MTIELDHTIVPARDKAAAARFFAQIFGLEPDPPLGPFVPVRVNDALTLDFADRPTFEPHHYAFHVTDADLDAVFARVRERGIEYSADPFGKQPGEINHRRGGRGFYFRDPDGHIYEVLTVSQRAA
jgi:catechol 2,3-dioxygenase-like lactoylglutathione lyase family enzyme